MKIKLVTKDDSKGNLFFKLKSSDGNVFQPETDYHLLCGSSKRCLWIVQGKFRG